MSVIPHPSAFKNNITPVDLAASHAFDLLRCLIDINGIDQVNDLPRLAKDYVALHGMIDDVLSDITRVMRKRGLDDFEVKQDRIALTIELAFSAALPPKIRNGRRANAADIELRKRQFALVHELYKKFLTEMVDELNENLAIDNTLKTSEAFEMVDNIKSDILWGMDYAADIASGR